MKNGVSTVPCGVVSFPRRAPVASVAATSNEKFTGPVYQGAKWHSHFRLCVHATQCRSDTRAFSRSAPTVAQPFWLCIHRTHCRSNAAHVSVPLRELCALCGKPWLSFPHDNINARPTFNTT